MDRPTFSQSWSRVSRLTPTLRPQVQIHRQLFHGEPWHVVHDPITNDFFRLNPVAYHLVGLLDGKRSIDEVWRLTLERFGDSAPTQNEVIGLLGQLNESNLLRVDLPADAAPLLKRQQVRRLRQIGGQFMSILSLKFPLFNPNRLVTWLQPIFRPVLSKWGLMAWAVLMVVTGIFFAPSFRDFVGNTSSVLDPNNWGWMLVIFLLIKTWHELGHGLVCKRLGGEVPEVGIMLLVLFPAPYVDATSSWNFPDKWRRLVVGAAGMMFELVIASIAVFVWLHAEDHSLPKQLAYNTIFLASVTTILFNANPLLRFDGYYMLSDLLEIPNLYERSGRHLRWIAQHYLFGVSNAQPASTIPVEEVILVIYGFASQIYRIIVMFGISMFIASQVPALGVVIGLWAVIAWMIVPCCKFIHWLVSDPILRDHRARAISVSTAIAAVLILGLGVIRMPDRRRAEGVIESEHRADLAMDTDGFIKHVEVESGQNVKEGQVVLVAENPVLISKRKEAAAELERLESVQRQALSKEATAAQLNKPKIDSLKDQLKEMDERIAGLTLKSPQGGVVCGGVLKDLEGQWIKRGQVVARVEDLSALRVTAMMDQAQNATPFHSGIRMVELRTIGKEFQVLTGSVLKKLDGGRTELPHPALGYKGGGSIPTLPNDPKGLKTERQMFELWLSLPPGAAEEQLLYPGERVYVRLTLDHDQPMGFQWFHRLRQVIRERLAV